MQAKLLAALGMALVALVAAAAAGSGAENNKDEAAIREVQVRQQEAWNRHDAKA